METKKQEHVDTPERIDAFLDALRESNLPLRAFATVKYNCDTPAKLKAAIDSDFAGRDFYGIGPKTKAKICAFYETFEKEHPASAYKELSPEEAFIYKLHRELDFLTDEDLRFIFAHHERTGHYPMFFILAKSFDNASDLYSQVARDFLGISGERKTREQIQEIYQLSKDKADKAIRHAKFELARAANLLMEVLDDDWDQYGVIFTKPVVNADYILQPFQQIAADEHLKMDQDCFLNLCGWLIGSLWLHEEGDYSWVVRNNGSQKFFYIWMLRDVRTARRIKSIEYFDLDEYCRDPQNWCGEEVIRKAVPTAIKLSKEIVLRVLGLPSKGNKIVLHPKK